jgi:hypothetical protein
MLWDLIHPKSWLPDCFGGFEFGNFTDDYGLLEAKLHAVHVSGFVVQNPKTNLALVLDSRQNIATLEDVLIPVTPRAFQDCGSTPLPKQH